MYYNPDNIHIYNESKQGEKYYGVYLAPYGNIGSIHGFNSFPDGIITLTVNFVRKFHVRQAFNKYLENK